MSKHFKRITQSLHLIDVPWAGAQLQFQSQCPNLRNFLLELPQPALLASIPMRNAYKTLPIPRLSAECLPNQTIAVVDKESPLLSLLQLPPHAGVEPCKAAAIPLSVHAEPHMSKSWPRPSAFNINLCSPPL